MIDGTRENADVRGRKQERELAKLELPKVKRVYAGKGHQWAVVLLSPAKSLLALSHCLVPAGRSAVCT